MSWFGGKQERFSQEQNSQFANLPKTTLEGEPNNPLIEKTVIPGPLGRLALKVKSVPGKIAEKSSELVHPTEKEVSRGYESNGRFSIVKKKPGGKVTRTTVLNESMATLFLEQGMDIDDIPVGVHRLNKSAFDDSPSDLIQRAIDIASE